MLDTLSICFLYNGEEPVIVLEQIAETFDEPEWDEIDVTGPREQYGVVEVLLVDTGEDAPVGGNLEAVAATDREWTTPRVPAIEMIVTSDKIEIGSTDTQVEKLLDLIKTVYTSTVSPPSYVYGLDPYHGEALGEDVDLPASKDSIKDGTIDDVTWLMLFPPSFAEAIGRERLEEAPAWRVEELDDGAVLLVAVENPTDPDGVDYSELRDYFGIDRSGSNY